MSKFHYVIGKREKANLFLKRLLRFYRKKFRSSDYLFRGDDEKFKEILRSCKVYAEYGCGKSTIWVAHNTSAKIYSVDTSKIWVDNVSTEIRDEVQASALKFIDLGQTGNWGRPLSYRKVDDFHQYTDWIWKQKPLPDTVLIDGRFRVCCWLTSLKYATPGTKLIFDDYVYRQEYHFVEKYFLPSGYCGRQAFFVIPEKSKIDFGEIDADINRFRNVMD